MQGQKVKKSIFKKWWFWVIIVFAIGIAGNLSQMQNNPYTTNINTYTEYDSKDENKKTDIQAELVGTWVNHKNLSFVKKLRLYDDGTGLWDSKTIEWSADSKRLYIEIGEQKADYAYQIRENTMYMNASELIKIDGLEQMELSSLINTSWKPDFTKYPNNYHIDNPILKITYVSESGKSITFTDEFGNEHSAMSNDGKRFTFDRINDEALFYGFTVYGLNPEENYDEPTIFVDVTEGGWYNVIYTME